MVQITENQRLGKKKATEDNVLLEQANKEHKFNFIGAKIFSAHVYLTRRSMTDLRVSPTHRVSIRQVSKGLPNLEDFFNIISKPLVVEVSAVARSKGRICRRI